MLHGTEISSANFWGKGIICDIILPGDVEMLDSCDKEIRGKQID